MIESYTKWTKSLFLSRGNRCKLETQSNGTCTMKSQYKIHDKVLKLYDWEFRYEGSIPSDSFYGFSIQGNLMYSFNVNMAKNVKHVQGGGGTQAYISLLLHPTQILVTVMKKDEG